MRDWIGLLTEAERRNLAALGVDFNQRCEEDLATLSQAGFHRQHAEFMATMAKTAELQAPERDALLAQITTQIQTAMTAKIP